MIRADEVTAILVTRGNVNVQPIIDTLPYGDIIVWDNSQREDLGIYGRYAAIAEAEHGVIYVQDDDLIVHGHDQLLADYEPGVLTVNYPQPWDIPWVARGAIFDAELPRRAFDLYLKAYEFDRDFTHYICDGIFGLHTDHKSVDHGSTDLPYCNDSGRVSTEPGWYDHRRDLIPKRCGVLNHLRVVVA